MFRILGWNPVKLICGLGKSVLTKVFSNDIRLNIIITRKNNLSFELVLINDDSVQLLRYGMLYNTSATGMLERPQMNNQN